MYMRRGLRWLGVNLLRSALLATPAMQLFIMMRSYRSGAALHCSHLLQHRLRCEGTLSSILHRHQDSLVDVVMVTSDTTMTRRLRNFITGNRTRRRCCN
ncbi:hypothetical protein E2C01_016798 [Portunus trituberculatus]|uniref:Uncharacterized protein n=1 Tax=Portunus trituberculatus TaxID=210409 RepID=A0A5B7DRH7_PORTR|nr:hypothetical protein [Portunus trituberculatus]